MSCARLVLRPLDQEARTEMRRESGLGEVRRLHIPKYLTLGHQAQKNPTSRQGLLAELLSSQLTPLHQRHWSQTQGLPHQMSSGFEHRIRTWKHQAVPMLQSYEA